MPALNGNWSYQSFRPHVKVGDIPAQIAGVWTPPSVMKLTTSESGQVTGTAVIRPGVAFNVRGAVTPRLSDAIPEGVELVVDGFAGASYRLRGYFLTGSDHVVGSVVAVTDDLGGWPVGTSGPFVLFPAQSE